MANTKPSLLFFLLSIFLSTLLITITAKAVPSDPSVFIEEKCRSTPYPDLCVSETKVSASYVQQSQLRLLEMATNYYLPNLDKSAKAVTRAQRSHYMSNPDNNNDATAQALIRCADFVQEAKDSTHVSINELAELLKKDPAVDNTDEATPQAVKHEVRRTAWGVMSRASETMRNMMDCVDDIASLETAGTKVAPEVGEVRKSVELDRKVAANVVGLVNNFLAF